MARQTGGRPLGVVCRFFLKEKTVEAMANWIFSYVKLETLLYKFTNFLYKLVLIVLDFK